MNLMGAGQRNRSAFVIWERRIEQKPRYGPRCECPSPRRIDIAASAHLHLVMVGLISRFRPRHETKPVGHDRINTRKSEVSKRWS